MPLLLPIVAPLAAVSPLSPLAAVAPLAPLGDAVAPTTPVAAARG